MLKDVILINIMVYHGVIIRANTGAEEHLSFFRPSDGHKSDPASF